MEAEGQCTPTPAVAFAAPEDSAAAAAASNDLIPESTPLEVIFEAPPNERHDEEEKQEVDIEEHQQWRALSSRKQNSMTINEDGVQPGAVAVLPPPGSVPHQMPLPPAAQEDDRTTSTITATSAAARTTATVVAHVVHDADQQLFAEFMSFLRRHQRRAADVQEVVVAEPLVEANIRVAPDQDDLNNISNNSSRGIDNDNNDKGKNRSRIFMAVAGFLAVGLAATIVGILLSQSKSSTSSATLSPTVSPVTRERLEMFRTLLLNQFVSSVDDLNNTTSPRYRSLLWLANDEQANVNFANTTLVVNRYVLATVFYSTNGMHWSVSYNFLSATSICDWHENGYGVTCNPLQIHLHDNGLAGTIPSELGRLAMLKNLTFSSNSALAGTIPTEIGMLTTLSWLSLSENSLSGSIPTELGRLSMLANMDLGLNRLSGTIPSKLGGLTMLNNLHLATNFLTGTIPTELGYLSVLNFLGLYVNQLSGTVPTVLAAIPYLATLYVDHNKFMGNLTRYFCDNSSRSTTWKVFEADCNSEVICSCCTQCYE